MLPGNRNVGLPTASPRTLNFATVSGGHFSQGVSPIDRIAELEQHSSVLLNGFNARPPMSPCIGVSRSNRMMVFALRGVLSLGLLAAVAAGQTAFVRVNQVGYVSGASKRAYLMASAAETGATFSIKNPSGSTV